MVVLQKSVVLRDLVTTSVFTGRQRETRGRREGETVGWSDWIKYNSFLLSSFLLSLLAKERGWVDNGGQTQKE